MDGVHGTGGSFGLSELISAGHGDALRADMQRYYGIDVVDIWRGTLPPSRVYALAEYLPSDGALRAELSGGMHLRDWTLQAQLTGHLLNVVRAADVNNIRVNGGKASAPEPLKVPAPGEPSRAPKINLAAHPMARKITR